MKYMLLPVFLGPLPLRGGFKTMPILKRTVPSSITNEIQLLDSKSFIKQKALQKVLNDIFLFFIEPAR